MNQYRVTGSVSVTVIHMFEVIKVEHNQHATFAASCNQGQFSLQTRHERSPVR
jgi:succinate dehydrogenase/fumarate reductase-like Fe-S protein